ncbi:MAG: hypothetical protein QG608_3324 [Actinomycetota bacterium]|nr:hypothetical protein [Actinomycetota bacterium]
MGRACRRCGVLLRGRATDGCCRDCSAAMVESSDPHGCPLLPEEVRTSPDMRAALVAGDWVKVLHVAAKAGVRQTHLAVAAGISQSAVSRLSTGQIRSPSIATVSALCDALGTPRRWAGLAEPKVDATDRRQVLCLGAASAALAASTLAEADSQDAVLLGRSTDALRRLEQRTPTRLLVSTAAAHVQLVASARARARHPREASQLAAREAEAAGLVAWLHVDLDETERAKRYYLAAVEAAELTRDPMLVVYMRASMADYATLMGAPAPALDLLRRCRDDLPANAPDIAWTWLEATAAAALAAAGRPEAERTLRAAGARLHGQPAEPVWPWLMNFDEAKLDRYRARAAASQGNHQEAARLYAISGVGVGKQGAVNMVARAKTLASGGQLDVAVDFACRAWDASQSLGSHRTARAVRAFRETLPPCSASTQLTHRMEAAW